MNANMRHFEAAIFDMDGLLLDSEKLALNAFLATCKKFSLGDLSDLFKQIVGTNPELGRSILQEGLQGLADHHEFHSIWDSAYLKLSQDKPIPLKKGVKELLNHIESQNMPMAVATSSITERARGKLHDSGILKFFDLVVGGDQVSHSKPDPEIYLLAAAELTVDATKCIGFEDSPNGVKSAVAAGLTVIQVPDLIDPDEDLLKLGHTVLGSLAEVEKFGSFN